MGSILVRTGRCTGRQQLCNRFTVNFLWENFGTLVWHLRVLVSLWFTIFHHGGTKAQIFS